MKNNILKIIKDNRNIYFCKKRIVNINIKRIIKENDEFRLYILSKDFSIYSEEKIEKKIELIIGQEGLTEISFFGFGSKKLEDIADNKVVNLWMENNNEKTLGIITSSEEDINEIEGDFYAFFHGGLSIKNENEYVKENYIFVDSEELYNLLLSFINQ